MSPTVGDLRDEIRELADRFERRNSPAFTKEDLAAICTALEYPVDADRLPTTAEMRAGALWKAGVLEEPDPSAVDGNFRKAELEAIRDALAED